MPTEIDTAGLIKAVIALIATDGVLIVGAVIGWYKFFRMLKREVKAADIKNAKDKTDALETMDEYVDKAVNKSVALSQRVADLEMQVAQLQKTQRESDCYIASLLAQIREAGIQNPITREEALKRGCK